jgi:glycosyltransferase involved in cell wall biosynthesis
MKEVFYWSPCLSKVGTVESTANSAIGLSRYGKNYKVKIINACGEWDNYKKKFLDNGVEVVDFPIKFFKFLPKEGYIYSRISYFVIFLFSFLPLLKLLKNKSPDFLIIHLITSLPLFLLFFFKFNTKIILRISGFPKLNIVRKKFWKSLSKKLYKITTPTENLLKQLMLKNIFEKEKIFYLPDAMLNIKKFIDIQLNYKSKNLDIINKKYFIAAGRLTKQKNFTYLINEFSNFIKENNNYNLLIFGEGEEEEKLSNLINKKNLSSKIHLMGFSENIYFYMKKSSGFILSSLWEEPGAVLIESAMSNTSIISSNCPYGPAELLDMGKFGLLYQNNEKNALKEKLFEFTNNIEQMRKKRVGVKKKCLKYTMFRHCLILNKILI